MKTINPWPARLGIFAGGCLIAGLFWLSVEKPRAEEAMLPSKRPTVFYATIPDIAKALPPRREDKQQDVILRVEAADYDKVVELARVRGVRLKVGVE